MSTKTQTKADPTLQNAKLVQDILNGAGSPRPVCSQCRVRETDLDSPEMKMLRCARCKAAFYCSASCQKKHFSFHRHSCRYSAQLKADVDHGRGDRVNNLSRLGDVLVEMGYRETDTIQNGGVYYRQALQYYVQILALDAAHFFHPRNPLEDKVLLLLVILGGDNETLKEWMLYSGSPRGVHYEQKTLPTVDDPKSYKDKYDVTFQILKLLIAWRKIAQESQEADKNQTKKEIEDLLECMRRHGKGEYLIQLRDSIPLSPEQVPELFRGRPGVDGNSLEVETSVQPKMIREFWLLLQDFIFLTPGLNSVLHEFVPEEE